MHPFKLRVRTAREAWSRDTHSFFIDLKFSVHALQRNGCKQGERAIYSSAIRAECTQRLGCGVTCAKVLGSAKMLVERGHEVFWCTSNCLADSDYGFALCTRARRPDEF